ncbi:MAG: TIR domain-containing protein [Candidatus Margulisbacteria bacterium]|nr:TIR domain-containing protein [Candidatus Margulisiibacteriota bacterium]
MYGYLNSKKKVFISFDFDNDSILRDFLVGQSKNSDSPFEIEDWSVKIPWDQSEWKQKCLTKIKKTDVVLVIVGQKTYLATGVKEEIKMAKEAGKKIYGIKGYSDKNCPRPDGLDGYYNWTWANLKNLLS